MSSFPTRINRGGDVAIIGGGSLGLAIADAMSPPDTPMVVSRQRRGPAQVRVIAHTSCSERDLSICFAGRSDLESHRRFSLAFVCLKNFSIPDFEFRAPPDIPYIFNLCNVPSAQSQLQKVFARSAVIHCLVYAQATLVDSDLGLYSHSIKLVIDQKHRSHFEKIDFESLFDRSRVITEFTSAFADEVRLKVSTTLCAHLLYLDRFLGRPIGLDSESLARQVASLSWAPTNDTFSSRLARNVSSQALAFQPSGIKDILDGNRHAELHDFFRFLSSQQPNPEATTAVRTLIEELVQCKSFTSQT